LKEKVQHPDRGCSAASPVEGVEDVVKHNSDVQSSKLCPIKKSVGHFNT